MRYVEYPLHNKAIFCVELALVLHPSHASWNPALSSSDGKTTLLRTNARSTSGLRTAGVGYGSQSDRQPFRRSTPCECLPSHVTSLLMHHGATKASACLRHPFQAFSSTSDGTISASTLSMPVATRSRGRSLDATTSNPSEIRFRPRAEPGSTEV